MLSSYTVMRVWWNGRHAGLRNQWATVQVRVLSPAPKNPHSKECGFFYPSRRLGISSPREVRCISSRAASRPCISSRASVHLPAAWWYTRKKRDILSLLCGWYTMLRIDDIPQQVADDIHAFGVIGMRDCGKLLNYFAKYDIILSKGVIVWLKTTYWPIPNNLQPI